MAYQTKDQLRRRDAWVRQQTVERIRERLPLGASDYRAEVLRILDDVADRPNILEGKVVHHKDGTPNNDLDNLELRDA